MEDDDISTTQPTEVFAQSETPLIFEIERDLSAESIKCCTEFLQSKFPDRKVVILSGGMKVRDLDMLTYAEKRLAAIENLLALLVEQHADIIEQQNALLAALGDDPTPDPEDMPQMDLDGNVGGRERDQSTSLG